jgi:hypothetical protein
MSARQSFVPRSESRTSTHAGTEHPFDIPLRNQISLGQPQRTGSHQNELDSMQPKTDSEKRARSSRLIGKHELDGKRDRTTLMGALLSSASGRFSGIYHPDMQSLAIPRRYSSPFRGEGSNFIPPSDLGISFSRPTLPIAKSASHKDLTISGLKDAHISTVGVSGLMSTSRVVAAPVVSYGSIHDGRHDDELSSNKFSLSKSRPTQLLEMIHRDVKQEIKEEDKTLLDAFRTNVVAHPVLLCRVKRTIQGTQEDEAVFSPPDEFGYMRRVKRVKIEEFPCELEDCRPDGASHSSINHTQLQLDLDDNAARQSSPLTGQPGAGAAGELSLDGIFANMDTFLDVETYMGLVQKWSSCSREEWLRGSEGTRLFARCFTSPPFCLSNFHQILVHTTFDFLFKWVLTAVV